MEATKRDGALDRQVAHEAWLEAGVVRDAVKEMGESGAEQWSEREREGEGRRGGGGGGKGGQGCEGGAGH